MAKRFDFGGDWYVYPLPESDTKTALNGYERMLGVISRANQMGYVYGKDFEIGFEYYGCISGDSPSNFYVAKDSAALKDKVFTGYMRGLSRMRSKGLVEGVKKWHAWTSSKDFPYYRVFKKFAGHQLAHLTYPGYVEGETWGI